MDHRGASGVTTTGFDLVDILVFGRGLDLVLRQIERDRMFCVAGREVQCAPLHRDLAVADAHEAAEVNHGGLWLALIADQDIDQAADILAVGIGHLLTQDGERLSIGTLNGHYRKLV